MAIFDLIREPAGDVYRLSPGCVAALQESVDGLYAWLGPERPEDLALLRPDGTPWLVSIAHERDSYLDLTVAEAIAVRQAVPTLADLIRAHETGSD